MLEPIRDILSTKYRLILASSSLRRIQIFDDILKLTYELMPPEGCEENLDDSLYSPEVYVEETAMLKAYHVVSKLVNSENAFTREKPGIPLVVSADTMIAFEDEIIGKPLDEKDSVETLKKLNGRDHSVLTGVVLGVCSCSKLAFTTVANCDDLNVRVESLDIPVDNMSDCEKRNGSTVAKWHFLKFHEQTIVHMASLTDTMIMSYVNTGEPFGKAGSYGIQHLGSTIIDSIKGDYFNVVGFPICKFSKVLSSLLNSFVEVS